MDPGSLGKPEVCRGKHGFSFFDYTKISLLFQSFFPICTNNIPGARPLPPHISLRPRA